MALTELSPEEINGKQDELLAVVPESENIGNKALREKLNWDEDLYWKIRSRLIERGILVAGRGKGGSVRRVQSAPPNVQTAVTEELGDESKTPGTPTPATPPDYAKESDLYPPIAEVLRNQWSKEQGFDSYLVEVTARQGSKATGGKWTRPDITVVGYKTFPYIPGRFLEVISFEVKPLATIDVSAVYEALAHRRASTRAFVIAHIPESEDQELESVIEAVCDEAKKFGVGVISAQEPSDFDTWEVLLDAERTEPDPGRLNEFIAQQTTPSLKEQIIRWFK